MAEVRTKFKKLEDANKEDIMKTIMTELVDLIVALQAENATLKEENQALVEKSTSLASMHKGVELEAELKLPFIFKHDTYQSGHDDGYDGGYFVGYDVGYGIGLREGLEGA